MLLEGRRQYILRLEKAYGGLKLRKLHTYFDSHFVDWAQFSGLLNGDIFELTDTLWLVKAF
jgi:hypothetical protein